MVEGGIVLGSEVFCGGSEDGKGNGGCGGSEDGKGNGGCGGSEDGKGNGGCCGGGVVSGVDGTGDCGINGFDAAVVSAAGVDGCG